MASYIQSAYHVRPDQHIRATAVVNEMYLIICKTERKAVPVFTYVLGLPGF